MEDRPTYGALIVEMRLPRVYGSFPTLFGAPLAETREELRGADVAFLGVPWRAPTTPGSFFVGGARANFEGTQLTPSYFRLNSLHFGGYLPELDIDVFEHLKLVDRGDADIFQDVRRTFSAVEAEVGAIVEAGCVPVVMGGNAGPTTYPVLKAIVERADGPVAILNLDAHGDNRPGRWEEDDPREPRWAATWALRILELPGVDPTRYYHFGLRGPRNDRGTLSRFVERGVERGHVYTHREIKEARRSGFEAWAEGLAQRIVDGAGKVWISLDPDVLDLGSTPDFASEPLGPTIEEVIELSFQVGHAAGRDRFGGISFMATPHDARALHHALIYVLLYTLAGTLHPGSANDPGP
jgi:arginase family enzyme